MFMGAISGDGDRHVIVVYVMFLLPLPLTNNSGW
jgi:hypothetical protein